MSLSGNTAKINELLSKINALPEAGSGGGSGGTTETCSLNYNDGGLWLAVVYQTESGLRVLTNPNNYAALFDISGIVKGTEIVVVSYEVEAEMQCVNLELTNSIMMPSYEYVYTFKITGDATMYA